MTDTERIKELETKLVEDNKRLAKIVAAIQKTQKELEDLKQKNIDVAKENDEALTSVEKQADEFETWLAQIETVLNI